MAEQQLANLGQRAAPLTRVTKDSEEFELLAVNATFDGTGAASAFLPCVEVVSDAGIVVARSVATETVAAGGSAEVTFAPFLGRSASGGDIKFDTHPQEGQYLIIDTTGGGFGGFGILLRDAGSEIRLESDDGAGNGQIDLASPFIRFDTDGASLRLLDSGETFFEGDGGASWFFDEFAVSVDGNLSNGEYVITLGATTGAFTIQNHLGQPIFRVDEDGDLHGKTGKALVFDL